ncbi:MAG: Nif3-like dinuclear metal center hexameric protein [Bacteroidales bacterium]
MKAGELCSYLDAVVPLSLQESYDNSGLQVGRPDKEIDAALLTLDVTEEVLGEAVSKGCGIIISHHPVIFNGLKKLAWRTPAERIIARAVKDDIAIYSSHTNLDMLSSGVSWKMAERLGLSGLKVLQPLKGRLLKLVTFVPGDHLDRVRDAVFNAGAGFIGNYDRCGFVVSGTGSFRAGEGTNPFAGEKGQMHYENESRFETVLFSHYRDKVVKALLEAHPYEEVAYDLYTLDNDNIDLGLGCYGYLQDALGERDFLDLVAGRLEAGGLRHSNLNGKMIRKVAVCGGSGSSLLRGAIACRADAFVTGDIKYHTWFDADNSILLADCGHFESEKFSTEVIHDLIIKKFPTFALRFSETNTNPINYL